MRSTKTVFLTLSVALFQLDSRLQLYPLIVAMDPLWLFLALCCHGVIAARVAEQLLGLQQRDDTERNSLYILCPFPRKECRKSDLEHKALDAKKDLEERLKKKGVVYTGLNRVPTTFKSIKYITAGDKITVQEHDSLVVMGHGSKGDTKVGIFDYDPKGENQCGRHRKDDSAKDIIERLSLLEAENADEVYFLVCFAKNKDHLAQAWRKHVRDKGHDQQEVFGSTEACVGLTSMKGTRLCEPLSPL
ncbi:unnamed protein product [Symbiodinium sp. CCMP2592]|nr:unnamed protein product [Symbiodinium sp. CCMP2592]